MQTDFGKYLFESSEFDTEVTEDSSESNSRVRSKLMVWDYSRKIP